MRRKSISFGNFLCALGGIICAVVLFGNLHGCASIGSEVNALKGSITGNTYECQFYSNTGELTMTAEGTNIDMNENIVEERSYSSEGGWGTIETLSSVITITVDGHQINTCGDTVLFVEKGLEPEVDFTVPDISSTASGISDTTLVAKQLNKYKNAFGKGVVVVIKSQLGDPIVAYSGDDVYWEVCQDLPKTTKLFIDGKALYIHRANFQTIDKDLL